MLRETSIYDEVPFPSFPFARSHPERLATIAKLAGLEPPPLTNCRILELGCASGGNIIPIADSLPDSKCLGVDLSWPQIEIGRKVIASAGLTNVTLLAEDILDFAASSGKFDFIVCHGVYSWAPAAVREKIMSICQEHLSDNGLAYVNYNTFPGWHVQSIVRDTLQFHCGAEPSPQARVRRGRDLVNAMVNAGPNDKLPYGSLIRAEFAQLQKYSDSFFFHAYLNVVNQPVYFHEFVADCENHQLKYVGDADLSVDHFIQLTPQLSETWRTVEPDWIRRQQLLDAVSRRSSRHSVVCRNARSPSYETPSGLIEIWLSADLMEDSSDPTVARFRSTDGNLISTQNWQLADVLRRLSAAWPKSVALSDLMLKERGGFTFDNSSGPIDDLWMSIIAGMVEPSPRPSRIAQRPGPKPLTSPLMRYQASAGQLVTSLRHQTLELGSAEREVLKRLDGTRSATDLGRELSSVNNDVNSVLIQLARKSLLLD